MDAGVKDVGEEQLFLSHWTSMLLFVQFQLDENTVKGNREKISNKYRIMVSL